MIEVLSSGAPNVVQDLGRLGLLSIGVSRSGAMDALALRAGNALVGNDEGMAGIEIGLFPFRLRFLADASFALTGAVGPARLDDQPLPPWWAMPARAGQTLVVEPPATGARVYLTFGGGLDLPFVMGSRSTDLKSAFGGVEGRGLRRGDRLATLPSQAHVLPAAGRGAALEELPNFYRQIEADCIEVRVTPAAEYDRFDDDGQLHFTDNCWLVTRDANRMGYRLQGTALTLRRPLELFSHGIVPGTVQVPPSGQPIIQLVEANTCGGYPKIANVIEADLWRLGQIAPGKALRFVMTSLDASLAAMTAQQRELRALRCDLSLLGTA